MDPAFIDGSKGRLFSAYFPAQGEARGAVLCLPPFCEEMNRSRSLMARQARAFAEQGHACLLFDLYGTGDSAGELEQADWDAWLADALAAADHLQQRSGHTPVLWGIRLGGLLAAQLAALHPQRFTRLLLWHPVSDGKTYMTQTLRLRVAALVDRNRPPEKTADMRTRLENGESVEISGYVVPGALACGIDQAKLGELPLAATSIDWLEPVADAATTPPGAVTRVTEGLVAAGNEVKLQPVVAPSVWILSERADAGAFVAASLDSLKD